jgi:endonuclease G
MKNNGETRIRIPIEITVRIGTVEVGGQGGVAPSDASIAVDERANVDPDYGNRRGYFATYLGEGDLDVPLPRLTSDGMRLVSKDPDAEADEAHLLRYHHYTAVMNKKRRLLFYAACNTTRDPDLMGTLTREELGRDKWILDPRIPAGHQVTTAEFYGPVDFDRGHVVRREDVYWGLDEDEAAKGNYDSFHYTNCTPQHPEYNQSGKHGIWGELENHIASEALDKDLKFSLFAGPVFTKTDPYIHDVQVPRRFWKVVVGARKNGRTLGVWAFVLSQAKLVQQEKDKEEAVFDPGEFSVYQVPLKRIEQLTEVRFDEKLKAADRYGLGAEEAVTGEQFIRLDDVRGMKL